MALGGRFEPAKGRRHTRILTVHGVWAVQLAVVVVQRGNTPVVLTRCSVEVLARNDLRFDVHPKGKLAGLARVLGFGGIRLRNPALEKVLVARTNRAPRVRTLLNDSSVSGPLVTGGRLRMRFKRVGWWRRRRVGPRARVLMVDADGWVQDPGRLTRMVELTRVVLDRLASLGEIDAHRGPETGALSV